MYNSHSSNLYLLLGTSGVGKTTVLEYLQENHLFETAKKYTTRASRNTESDRNSFIFCNSLSDFQNDNLLIFESYGNYFGIQLESISSSLAAGKNHVLTVGDKNTIEDLKALFPHRVKTILLYCDYETLKRRVLSESDSRTTRWETIETEIKNIYNWLGCIDYILDCSLPFQKTKPKMDHILFLEGIISCTTDYK